MTTQLDFTFTAAKRDDAISRALKHADTPWVRAAKAVVRCLAWERTELTTDDVWAVLDSKSVGTHERRALGPVMIAVAREGLIAQTDRTRNSVRPACNCRPIRVWRSLVRSVA